MAALMDLNPRLVILSVSGFGHDGPQGGLRATSVLVPSPRRALVASEPGHDVHVGGRSLSLSRTAIRALRFLITHDRATLADLTAGVDSDPGGLGEAVRDLLRLDLAGVESR